MMLLKLLVCVAVVGVATACTSFVIGKKATIDGSVMCTHTNDGEGMQDPRLVRVPARDHEPGSQRPVWPSPGNYPRYVGFDRGAEQYFPSQCEGGPKACAPSEALGYIPEVNHTYAYFETTYGIMNEMQVGMGESTCSGVYFAKSVADGGKALFSVDQLAQVAMERASSARMAIEIMGKLAEEYGFYGADASVDTGAESLVVIDPNEGWVFHVLADPTGTSAIWGAARVPDDSVAAVTNMFSIREMDFEDTDNYLGRQDMWDLAKKEGLWDSSMAKDFTATFSHGEYNHKYYSGRRMWSVFRHLAASQNLDPEYGNLKTDKPYPFAVPVDGKVGPADIFAVLRDHYEGSPYDTGKPENLAAGPFGTPDRYPGGNGTWERTISIYRTTESFLVQARGWLPNEVGGLVWFGAHAAQSTAYVPVVIGMERVPDTLSYGHQGVYNASTSFWAHSHVNNVVQIKYNYMIKDIHSLQTTLETTSYDIINAVSAKFDARSPLARKRNLRTGPEGSPEGSISVGDAGPLGEVLTENANHNREAFKELMTKLLFKYADGMVNEWKEGEFEASVGGYPNWWVDDVNKIDGVCCQESS